MGQPKRIRSCLSKGLFLVVIGLSLAICLSCDSYDSKEMVLIDDASLNWDDTVSFQFTIKDTTSLYNLFLEVDHSTGIPFQNVYFKVRTYVDDQAIQEQVVSLELANAKGYWLGDCNDDVCLRKIPFIVRTSFEQLGTYTIELQQYTRDSVLVGINSFLLGLKSIKE